LCCNTGEARETNLIKLKRGLREKIKRERERKKKRERGREREREGEREG